MDPWSDIMPVSALRQGDWMRFEPTTLSLHINQSLASILNMDAGRKLQEALASHSNPKSTRNEIFARVPESAANFACTVAHELDHLRRYLGTSFGLVCHHLPTCDVSILQRQYQRTSGNPPADVFPLFDATSTAELTRRVRSGGRHEFLRLLRSSSSTSDQLLFSSRKALKRALIDGVSLEHSTLALGGLLTLANHRSTPPAVDFSLPSSLSSRTSLEIHGRPLNARALLEFLATYQGLNSMIAFGGRGTAALNLFLQGAEYSMIAELWRGLFGSTDHFSKLAVADGELDLKAYRTMPLELFAAIDLALWIPISPQGLFSKTGSIRWEDLEPGTRFWRCLDALKRSGLELSPIGGSERNERFGAAQDALADSLDWPRVDELLDEWLKFFETSRQAGSFNGYFYESPHEYPIELTIDLLVRRRDSPFDVVLNNSVSNHNPRFAAWWIGLESEIKEIKPQWEGQGKDYAFKMFVLHALSSNLLTGLPLTRLSPSIYKEGAAGLNQLFKSRSIDWNESSFASAIDTFFRKQRLIE